MGTTDEIAKDHCRVREKEEEKEEDFNQGRKKTLKSADSSTAALLPLNHLERSFNQNTSC